VLCEPVSCIISLISGKNTGNFADSGAGQDDPAQDVAQTQRSTGQFPKRVNREIGADNRESFYRYQGKGFPSGRYLLEGVILGSNILRADHRSQAQLGVPGRVGGFLVRSACWCAFGGFMFGIIADYIGRVTTRRDLIPAGLAATGLAASGAPVQARPAQKTFVLVHGSWGGGWACRRVTDQLKGHKCCPDAHGPGERSHAQAP
jgi:hypothetical protein